MTFEPIPEPNSFEAFVQRNQQRKEALIFEEEVDKAIELFLEEES